MRPSSILFRRIAIGLSLLGIVISSYLTWSHFTNISVICIGSNGCDIVQQSIYSTIAGLPVAILGLVGYSVILALLLLEQKGGHGLRHIPLILFGVTLIGAAYSIYLTYLEIFVLFAICEYCAASAIIMLALFGFAVNSLVTLDDEQVI